MAAINIRDITSQEEAEALGVWLTGWRPIMVGDKEELVPLDPSHPEWDKSWRRVARTKKKQGLV